MTIVTPDKRVLARWRSMNLVYDAFFSLLQHECYGTITVSKLIRHSGVARSTFYRHFSSVSDVVEGWFRCLDDRLDGLTGGKVDLYSRDYLVKVFTLYRDIGDRLLICERAGLSGRFIQAIRDYHINSIGDMPSESLERYALYYYAGAIYGVAAEWIARGMKETPEQIANTFLSYGAKPTEGERPTPHQLARVPAATRLLPTSAG